MIQAVKRDAVAPLTEWSFVVRTTARFALIAYSSIGCSCRQASWPCRMFPGFAASGVEARLDAPPQLGNAGRLAKWQADYVLLNGDGSVKAQLLPHPAALMDSLVGQDVSVTVRPPALDTAPVAKFSRWSRSLH